MNKDSDETKEQLDLLKIMLLKKVVLGDTIF